MKRILHYARRLLVEEDGPATVEYAVLLALIMVVTMPGITALGQKVRDIYFRVVELLPEPYYMP